jgi:hypothetical protein
MALGGVPDERNNPRCAGDGQTSSDPSGRNSGVLFGHRRDTGTAPPLEDLPASGQPRARISWWLPVSILCGIVFWAWILSRVF